MSVSGNVFIDGLSVNPTSCSNSISYVSQTDMLIGDLTAEETLTTSAVLKLNTPKSEIDDRVNSVLQEFGIDHVKDTYIGTIFRAGLSGGQKRRVEVGTEVVAPPSVLLLDEPTSGLDGSIAYEVLLSIRNLVNRSQGRLSVALSIHQPNNRILKLFDHILILGQGNMVFFGTLDESIAHFTSLGVPPPSQYTPTDFYLQITDSNFSDDKVFDFEGAYCCSKIYFHMMDLLDDVQSHGLAHRLTAQLGGGNEEDIEGAAALESGEDAEGAFNRVGSSKTAWWTQYGALLHRELLVAMRDPTLYYLQSALELMFGVMVGCVFYQLDYKIDSSMYYVPGGLLWLCMMMIYMQVFKVYHLRKADIRFAHEYANNSYSIPVFWFAEMTISAIGILFYIPSFTIGYFMMGFPGQAYGFILLLMCTVSGSSIFFSQV